VEGQCDPFSPIANGQNNEDIKILKRYFMGGHGGEEVKKGGVVVEMGGLNGITFSNSLIFEYCYGWKTILIEANPSNFRELINQRPCATTVWGACCPKTASDGFLLMEGGHGTSHMDMFESKTKKRDSMGGKKRRRKDGQWVDVSPVSAKVMSPCRTMAGLFHELKLTWVDFWSLDVEGAELMTLQSVDWTKVSVGVLLIEMGKDDAEIHSLLTTTARMFRMPTRLADYPACQLKTKEKALRPAGAVNMYNSLIYVHESMRDDVCK